MANFLASIIFKRFILALGIILLGLALFWLYNLSQKLMLSRKKEPLPFELNGKPTILYFTTPDCVPCKTIQRPALRKLKKQIGPGNIQIVEIDATKDTKLAKQWSVLSVPTTFFIDVQGKVRHINHGVTSFEKLYKQTNSLSLD